ncbi:hypothetical protein CTRI78_v008475 [Colletotrichum trifolii]|uniref:Uncharacterized protein n=1 Tax=Colletotrichum trifolii TaxID=5466 RepID=A0A4R8QUP3_COLTR|nr:hypothetical protein CTRI78_v008475 [Colletotrichum trifolii]
MRLGSRLPIITCHRARFTCRWASQASSIVRSSATVDQGSPMIVHFGTMPRHSAGEPEHFGGHRSWSPAEPSAGFGAGDCL